MDSFSGWTQIAWLTQPGQNELNAISTVLTERGIRHHLEQRRDGVVLWVEEAARAGEAVEAIESLRSQLSSQTSGGGAAALFREFPVVLVCIIGSVLGALLVSFRFDLVHYFTFQDFILSGDRIGFYGAEQSFQQGHYWRLLTPAFLHFGLFHLLFNCLWLWELGRRIEKLAGSWHMLALVLLTGVVANLGQYGWSGPSLFGGMSGVVYGLLGYIGVRHRIEPQPLLAIPPGVIVFMLAWLVICMTGIINLFMQGSVANAAHVGGLLSGVAMGWWAAKKS